MSYKLTWFASVALLFAACFVVCGCSSKSDGEKMEMQSGKMSDGKPAADGMQGGRMMGDGKMMSDGKMMTDGKMTDGKMSDGKMSDGKMTTK